MANRQQLYALIVATFLLLHLGIHNAARVVRKQRMKVFTENIISTLEVSLTQCHLKCKIDNECIGYGTVQNTQLGERTKCYLLREDRGKYSQTADKRSFIDLYVVEMDRTIDTNLGQDIKVTITTRRSTTTTTTKGKTKTTTKSPTTTTVTTTTLPTNKIIATTTDVSTTAAEATATTRCPDKGVHYGTKNGPIVNIITSWRECGAECAKTEDCNFWVFDKFDAQNIRLCFLHTKKVPTAKMTSPGTVSGLKICAGLSGTWAVSYTTNQKATLVITGNQVTNQVNEKSFSARLETSKHQEVFPSSQGWYFVTMWNADRYDYVRLNPKTGNLELQHFWPNVPQFKNRLYEGLPSYVCSGEGTEKN